MVNDRLDHKKQLLDEQFAFLVERTVESDSEEGLTAIQKAIDETEGNAELLSKDYELSINQANQVKRREAELRRRKAKLLSNRLIEQKINIPIFPDYVRKAVEDSITVSSPYEVPTVADAMFEYGLGVTNITITGDEAMIRKKWQVFIEGVQRYKWHYLRKLAAAYRKRWSTEK